MATQGSGHGTRANPSRVVTSPQTTLARRVSEGAVRNDPSLTLQAIVRYSDSGSVASGSP
jgi:hypothetical protein